MKLLITGAEGLIGRELRRQLTEAHITYLPFDNCIPSSQAGYGDISQPALLQQALEGCTGIIHLAAVSRVIWGERDPIACWDINVNGTRNVLEAATNAPHQPWVIYASSREVYGQQSHLPVSEDTPRQALNFYAQSKMAAEDLVESYRQAGLKTAIVRFSNVFGDTLDHTDRVVPAFCRAAAFGGELYIEGKDNVFDFTYAPEVVRGLRQVINQLEAGTQLPPIHFTSGRPTTLAELANLANELGGGLATLTHRAARHFDVARFYGDIRRAQKLLDWQHQVPLAEALSQLINAYRTEVNLQQEAGAIL